MASTTQFVFAKHPARSRLSLLDDGSDHRLGASEKVLLDEVLERTAWTDIKISPDSNPCYRF